MCGRFTLGTPLDRLGEEFGIVEWPDDYRPRYNIAPSQPVLALRVRDDQDPRRLQAVWLRWGLIPFWAKDPAIGNRLINARAETAASKPAFRHAFRARRCLVLADGFYEWRKAGATKVPMHIRLAGGRPFAFAGLWERWRPDPDGDVVESCTLLTTDAAPEIAAIHHRMPVLLGPADRDRWLEPDADPARLQDLLHPFADPGLEAYAVSRFVNSPANDSPECVQPV